MKCRLYPNKTTAEKIDDILYGLRVAHNVALYDIWHNLRNTKEYIDKDNKTYHFPNLRSVAKADYLAEISDKYEIIKKVPRGRPKKIKIESEVIKMPRGRPKKIKIESEEDLDNPEKQKKNYTFVGGLQTGITPEKIEPFPTGHKEFYRCATCGRVYEQQHGYFAKVFSPIYAGNNNYITTCNICLDNLYQQYFAMTGSKNRALKRMCLHFDVYFNDKFTNFEVKTLTTSMFKKYISKAYLTPNTGKTYDVYLYEQARAMTSQETRDLIKESKAVNDGNDIKSKKDILEKWGDGYKANEIKQLEYNYNSFMKTQVDKDNVVIQAMVKELCETDIMKKRAREAGQIADYEKLSKLYKSTAKELNATPKEQSSITEDACWSKWVSDIEHYCPVEYYKNKKIFKDFDLIREYCNRFILRPLKNLLLGTKEKDKDIDVNNKPNKVDKFVNDFNNRLAKNNEDFERAIDENDKIVLPTDNDNTSYDNIRYEEINKEKIEAELMTGNPEDVDKLVKKRMENTWVIGDKKKVEVISKEENPFDIYNALDGKEIDGEDCI